MVIHASGSWARHAWEVEEGASDEERPPKPSFEDGDVPGDESWLSGRCK